MKRTYEYTFGLRDGRTVKARAGTSPEDDRLWDVEMFDADAAAWVYLGGVEKVESHCWSPYNTGLQVRGPWTTLKGAVYHMTELAAKYLPEDG